MPNFFSFFKNKKALLFIFLLIFVGAIIIPRVAFADSSCQSFDLGWIGNALLNALFSVSMTLPLFLTAFFADLAGTFLGWVLVVIKTIPYTSGVAVDAGWPIVRDLANMMIVLGFVIIGIATALRFQEYEAKRLLGKLIVIAILVNFSLLFCGIFIDITNTVMNFFFAAVNGSAGSGSQVVAFANISASWAAFSDIGGCFLNYAPKLVALMFFNFVAIFIYALYVVVLMARIFALWALVIFSPLAFVCSVFPATQKVWNQWSSNFIQWCIIGIPASLFYYISAKMIEVFTHPGTAGAGKLITDTPFSPSASSSSAIQSIVSVIQTNLGYTIPGVFLLVGFVVSLQFSAGGAGAIMSFANKNKGKIAAGGLGALSKANSAITGAAGKGMSKAGEYMQLKGAGMGRVGGAARLAGMAMSGAGAGAQKLSRTDLRASVQKAKSGISRFGEKVGAVPTGTTSGQEGKTISEAQGRLSAEISKGGLNKVRAIARGEGASGRNPFERAAATAAMLKSGNFDVSDSRQVEGLKNFQERGGNLGEYSSKNPLLARHDVNKMNNYTAPTSKGGLGMSQAAAGDRLEGEAYQKLSAPNIVAAPKEALKNENFALTLMRNPKRVGKAAENMTPDQISAIKDEHMVKRDSTGKALAGHLQPAGVQKMLKEANKHPKGSPERAAALAQMKAAQDELQSNPYFA